MRENLFHGKRKDNGEWVEGCLLGSDVIVPKGQPFYICHDILDSALKAYEVIPETVIWESGSRITNIVFSFRHNKFSLTPYDTNYNVNR